MSDQDLPQCSQPPTTITPRSSLGSGAALSYSSGSSISPSSSSSSQGSAKSAVSECLGAWLNYLQIMNNLCSSGYRLAQTISTLEQWINADQQTPGMTPGMFAGAPLTTAQFTSAWDDLARATVVATSTVKSHIVTVLQDYVTQSVGTFEHQDGEQQRIKEHNQKVVMENAQTMINLQHQFCVASYDSFSHLMCCFVCQAPVGCVHDPDCALLQPQPPYMKLPHATSDPRSQTPSPHFGSSRGETSKPFVQHDMYRMPLEGRSLLFGSGSTQSSSDHSCSLTGTALEQTTRGPSPHHDIRGPSPVHGFLETIRGPLPNPGHLMGMKAPFYRGSRSPLNFPMLFPLNQRRWSEAAAGEVSGEGSLDAESQMRRWSMPWEASKTDRTTVSWHQTRLMPMSKLLAAVPMPISKSSSDRSQSTTPDSVWQSSVTSQDGLAEAIQLLSCRPVSRLQYPPQQQQVMHQPPPPFIEEPHTSQILPNIGPFGLWPIIPNPSLQRVQERHMPFIKFPPDKPFDNNNPQPPT